MNPLYINKSRSDEIRNICMIDDSTFEGLIDNIDSVPISSGVIKLKEYFDRTLNEEISDVLLRHVVSLCLLYDKEDCEPNEALAALRVGLVDARWTSDDLSLFDKKREKFDALISHDAVYLSTKSGQLFAADQSHLHSVRTITDIRPVFGRKREHVRASLVYSSLSLIVGDGAENETSIAVALGYDDLKRLHRECDRAIQKIHAIRELQNSALGTLIIYGENDS